MEQKKLLLLGAVAIIAFILLSGVKLGAQSIVSVSEVRFDEASGGFLITKIIDVNEDILFQKGTTIDLPDGKKVTTTADILIKTRPVTQEMSAAAIRLLKEGDGRLQYRDSDFLCTDPFSQATELTPYGFGSRNVQIVYDIELYKNGLLLENKSVSFGGISTQELQQRAPSSVTLYGGKVVVSNIGTLGGGVQLAELADVVVYKQLYGGVSEPRSKSAFFSSVLQRICADSTHDAKFVCQSINHDCNAEARANFNALSSPSGYGGFKSFNYFDSVTGKWSLYEDQRPLLATIFVSKEVADAVFIQPNVAKPTILSISDVGAIQYNFAKHFCATIRNDGQIGQVEIIASSGGNIVTPSVQRVTINAGETRSDICFDQFGQQAGSWNGNIQACGISQFSAPACVTQTYSYTISQPAIGAPAPTAPPGQQQIGTGGSPGLVIDCAKFGNFVFDTNKQQCVPSGSNDWVFGLLVIVLVIGGGYYLLKRYRK